MAYQSWSVVFGEQPSAAKWNILGTNDASFNDGTGVEALSWATAVVTNPYKFSAYRNAAYTTAAAALTKLPFDTELYDTNGNFDNVTNNRYVAPVAGFYQFNSRTSFTTTRGILTLYKNGSEVKRGDDQTVASSAIGINVSGVIQLAATDYVEVFYFSQGAVAMDVGQVNTWFDGHLVSRL